LLEAASPETFGYILINAPTALPPLAIRPGRTQSRSGLVLVERKILTLSGNGTLGVHPVARLLCILKLVLLIWQNCQFYSFPSVVFQSLDKKSLYVLHLV